MNAGELFKAGKLQDAIESQIKEVKANPADQGKRLFLFELQSFAGDLDRAQRQIEAVKYTEMELDAAVMAYRKILDAERLRRRLFSDGLQPQFFSDPPEHVKLRLEAVNRIREKNPAEATKLLEQAESARPALPGKLNEKAFESLRDCDDLFAGVLEVFAHGIYYWVPLESVAALSMNAPKFPRDLLWIPARLETRDNAAGDIFLPALYPGSSDHESDQVKLGRQTLWSESETEPVRGTGLRLFLVDDDASSILEWRKLELSADSPPQ
jgi:type VI secretion system protein ImpE